MFDPFGLSCLDYLIWLRSGQEATLRLSCSQSTISRNAKAVAESLGLDARKLEGEWSLDGDLSLLNAEREVHQFARWQRNDALRIDGIYGAGAPYLEGLSDPWVCGRSNFMGIPYPMVLLSQSILDVWIGCYPDLPEDDDRFAVIPLSRYPAYFLVDRAHPLLESPGDLTLEDLRGFPVLSLPDGAFPKMQQHLKGLGLARTPVGTTRHDPRRWEGRTEDQLTISYGSPHTVACFAGAKVALPLSTGLTLGDSLVVKRRFADSDAFVQLVAQLRARAQSLSASRPELVSC
ncbi:MAG: hypothetical protein EBW30_01510 [Synechococcaceae bacterium WB7_3xG_012]|nr:hypothetical protein [Synechococcaceae bacterium WB7_3xG_012]